MSEEDPRSDEELVRRAGRGDARAFEALYFRYRALVYSLARRFAGSELAADVAQEVFAYLVARLPGLDFRGRLAAFLYPVVKHVAAAERRRERRQAPSDRPELELLPAETPAPRESEDLAAALKSLPDAQREVVLLRFADGFSLEEIATTLAVPLGTVKSRLHHALAALRVHPRTRGYHAD